MNIKNKLISRILNHPFDVRFEALDKLLKSYGFECRIISGSCDHLVYKRPGLRPLPIPRTQLVKSCYVKQALTLIQDLIEPDEELVNLWIRHLNIILGCPTLVN